MKKQVPRVAVCAPEQEESYVSNRSLSYNRQIDKYEVMSEEEMIRLVEIRDHCDDPQSVNDAIDKLTMHNLRLVRKFAKNDFPCCGLLFADIIQVGNMALMHIMQKNMFDPRRGKLSVYLRYWMRRFVNEESAKFHSSRVMAVGMSSCTKARQLEKFSQDFESEHHRLPSDEEIAAGMELGIKQIRSLKNLSEFRRIGVGIDIPALPEKDLEEDVETAEAVEYVKIAVQRLSPMRRDIIMSRFELDGRKKCTLKQLGERHGRSAEMMRQLQNSSLKELRRTVKILKQGGKPSDESVFCENLQEA